jgi:beta-galactosidase
VRKCIDQNWRFYPGAESPFFGVSNDEIVIDLPHDYSISQKRDPRTLSGAANGFFPGGLGCYKKSLFVTKEWENQQIGLEFEGVYMNAAVHVNRQSDGKLPKSRNGIIFMK